MTTATIRDLRYRFPELEARLRRGETIQVFKRKAAVCTLVPCASSGDAEWPDFAAIRRAIWGKKRFKGSGTQWIREDREPERLSAYADTGTTRLRWKRRFRW